MKGVALENPITTETTIKTKPVENTQNNLTTNSDATNGRSIAPTVIKGKSRGKIPENSPAIKTNLKTIQDTIVHGKGAQMKENKQTADTTVTNSVVPDTTFNGKGA